jgi:TPR repeat protein
MNRQLKALLLAAFVFTSLAAGAAELRQSRFWYSTTKTNADGTLAHLINGVWSNVDVEKLKREAEAGTAQAQADLAACLYDGRHGVATNYVAAYKWAVVAASQKEKSAKYLVAEMDLFLTPQQSAEGKKAAKAFLDEQGKKR